MVRLENSICYRCIHYSVCKIVEKIDLSFVTISDCEYFRANMEG